MQPGVTLRRGSSSGTLQTARSGFGSFQTRGSGGALHSGRSGDFSETDWADAPSDSDMSGAVHAPPATGRFNEAASGRVSTKL